MTAQIIIDYLQHKWRATHLHGVHSPFVFQLYTEVIADNRYYYCFDYIEDIRNHLQKNQQAIEVNDYGTGSKFGNQNIRKINQIIKSASSPKKGRFLFRLVHFLRPKTLFELGTNLGIGTLYMAEACNKEAHFFTYEGCPNIAYLAQKTYANTPPTIHGIVGNLDETLSKGLAQIQKIDFVFFDANHNLESTISYFELCLSKIQDHSCFVFDDIYTSSDMKQAWNYIQNHASVKLSIDLFDIGLVFFRPYQPKQHFSLRL